MTYFRSMFLVPCAAIALTAAMPVAADQQQGSDRCDEQDDDGTTSPVALAAQNRTRVHVVDPPVRPVTWMAARTESRLIRKLWCRRSTLP